MYKNLKDYINTLENEGELLRIKTKVDSLLEITEITDRVSKRPDAGKALLFENTPEGFAVLTNMMGSKKRMALALRAKDLDEPRERIASIFKKALAPKLAFADKFAMLPLLAEMAKWLPKRSKSKGECQQIVYKGEDVDLSKLPILKCWPKDGGRFITLPLVHTLDPNTGAPNVGMYRMQVLSKNTTGMHWQMHKTGAKHFREYAKLGKIMPVTVCLGGDPAYTYASTAPMPENMDEYILAGFLRQKSVKLVKSLTNDIWIPSDCDFALEGYLDYREDKITEGPFGDHTGFYSLEDQYPVFHLTAITHRKDAIYPATIVGIPPQEDAYIAEATEKIFLEPIRMALLPEIADMYMPRAGVAHNLAIVSTQISYNAQAKKIASSMWGAGQMMFNKALVITPENTVVRDEKQIQQRLKYFNPSKDVFFSSGVYDVLDHATATLGQGGKIALDLSSEEEYEPLDYEKTASALWHLAEDWRTVIFPISDLELNDKARTKAKEFISSNKLKGIKALVIASENQATLKSEDLLWQITANTEVGRDCEVFENILIIDARAKISGSKGNPQRWPNIVLSSKETRELVDRRWAEYNIGEMIVSPSDEFEKLAYGEEAQR